MDGKYKKIKLSSMKWFIFTLIIMIVDCPMIVVFSMFPGSHLASAGEGGKIAFSKLITDHWQIVVTDENGQNMINLSNNNANDAYPAWSYNGKYIAFASDRDGAAPRETLSLYIMDADGSNQRPLTKKDDEIREQYPSFSPDSKKLVFTRVSKGWNKPNGQFIDRYRIYVIDIDGNNERYLADGAYAKWSPDGKKIAFNPFSEFNDCIVNDIAAIDIDGKNQVNIAINGSCPSWSIDGRYIVFSRHNVNANSDEIYKMDSDGNNLTRLTQGKRSSIPVCPSWSPDGKQVIFWDRATYNIYKVSADGGVPVLTAKGNCLDPSWYDHAYYARIYAVNPMGKLTDTWGGIRRR